MDDLIAKYFLEDMTADEEEALNERLLRSPEDSLRWASLAEAAYRSYGLPEPARINTQNWPRPGKGWSPWIPAVLLGVGLAAWLIARAAGLTGKPAMPAFLAPAAPLQASIPAGFPRRESLKGPVPALSVERERLEKPSAAVREASTDSRAAFTPGPAGKPIDLSANPHRGHSDIEIIVRWREPGPLKVAVFTQGGKQVALLYDGFLARGKWAFDWDGRLPGGHSADPGHYEIRAQAGARTQTHPIVIRKRAGAE